MLIRLLTCDCEIFFHYVIDLMLINMDLQHAFNVQN